MPALFAFFSGIEIVVIAVVILLLFGSRVPALMRSLGQGVVEFKKGVQGVEEDEDAQARAEHKNK